MSVIFDQLRISDDGNRMYIDLHVNKASHFDKVYLDSLIIMTADKVSETDPKLPTEDFIYAKKLTGNEKELHLSLTLSDFAKSWETDYQGRKFQKGDMSKNLFFVYVRCKGTPDACTPCTLDEEITLGVVFDENILHQRVMGYTKQLTDACHIPMGFVDFILLWNAFKSSVETEHYQAAIRFFNMLFGSLEDTGSIGFVKGCGCHG